MRCDTVANYICDAFRAAGESPVIIKITDLGRVPVFKLADGKTNFSTAGWHYATYVNGRVYDALTGGAGLTLAEYKTMLQSLNIVPVITGIPP